MQIHVAGTGHLKAMIEAMKADGRLERALQVALERAIDELVGELQEKGDPVMLEAQRIADAAWRA